MKHTAITILVLAILSACGGKNAGNSSFVPARQDWTVDVYALENYDEIMTDCIAAADDRIMREAFRYTNSTPLSDTARVNRAIRDNIEVFDSLGVNAAWMPCGDSANVSLVLLDSDALLSDTIHACQITDCPDGDESVLVAFSFNNRHEWEFLTRARVGHRIAVAVNGEVVNTPVVNRSVSGGGCTVVVPEHLARRIFYGAGLSMRKND